MTILTSGTLGLQDAGTNPSSFVLVDTGFGNFSMGADTSFGLHRPYQSYFDGEVNSYDYDNDQVVDGTAYVYKKSSSSIYHDSNHLIGFFTYSGYDSYLGKGLISHMNSQYAAGQSYVSTRLGLNASSSSTLGSTTIHTYADVNGVSRTINSIGAIQNTHGDSGTGSSQNEGNMFWLSMDGNVPNDNDTFFQITVYDSSGNGMINTRSGAEYIYDGTHSTWTWYNIADSSISFVNWANASRLYMIRSGNTTFNNGIAEEMGGADSSNVTASDYYKGGTYHNTPGIPTSGNALAFSDFYGKAFVANMLHSTTWVAGYANVYGYVNSGYNQSPFGSMTDNTFNLSDGKAVKIITLQNLNQSTLYFIIQPQSGSMTFTNGGWSQIKVWRNQSNNSGTPTLTLNRTDMTYSAPNNGTTSAQANWYIQGSYAIGTYFGTAQTNCFLEIH